jgi:8-oxo-dGTP pyrophosphatase MutT (NUDIX family)
MESKIYRAGLIPFIRINNNIEMMFMKPSDSTYGGTKYQIAKGKVEDGESFKDAAIREAKEELGFTMLNSIGEVHDLGNFLGRTQFYTVEIKNKDMFGLPHFETQSTKWMTEDQFLKTGRTLHNSIVKAAIRMIKGKI